MQNPQFGSPERDSSQRLQYGQNNHQSVQNNTFEPWKIGTYRHRSTQQFQRYLSPTYHRQIPEQSIFLTYCHLLFLNYSPNKIQNGRRRIGCERIQTVVRL